MTVPLRQRSMTARLQAEKSGDPVNAAIPPARTTDHAIDSVFTDRWSPRAFDATPITEAEVLGLLEAARWAPSSANVQPWRFVVALRGEPGFDGIAGSLTGNNPLWAPKAAALIVVGSTTQIVRPDGTRAVSTLHAFDAGAAWMSLALEAQRQGWHTHAMGGFDRNALTSAVNLPADHAIHAVVAIGRIADPATLPEALRAREVPSGRRPVAESVVRGSFPAS